ncbi:unnamed protein product, partial [Hapterophycus canaliculatus]
MCSRGLRTSLLGVVVGAATVESMTLTARSGSGSFLRVMAARASSSSPSSGRSSTTSMSVDAGVDAARYTNFIKDKAKFPNPPKRLPTLLRFLQHKGLTPVDPADRAGLHPFLVPLVK